MGTRVQVLALALVAFLTGSAYAQPGTVYLQAGGGGMIPVGGFQHEQNIGGAYTISAGYAFLEYLDMQLAFTHSFNDNDNDHDTVTGPGFKLVSDETKQTFLVGFGPRVNFLPSRFAVRPYMLVHAEWFHFANYNNVQVDGVTVISDDDQDAAGIRAGLGLEGTIFRLYERKEDELPVLEVTLGAEGSFHQAFMPNRDDRQFVTVLGSLGVRF